MKGKHIELSLYAQEKNYIIKKDIQRDTKIVNMEPLRKALKKELKKLEFSVVVEGHYCHDLFNDDEVSYVFVLRKAPWELGRVLQRRKYIHEKIWENLEAEIMGIIMQEAQEKFVQEKLYEIDTTQKTPEKIALEIQEIIEGEPTSFNPIDWITCPETLQLLMKRTCT
jgi:adenylate kinase